VDSDRAPDGPARWLLRLHLALAALPLLFLAAALAGAAGSGFTPEPEDYPRVRYRPGPAADVVLATWRGNGMRPADRVVAVWGLADEGRAVDAEADGLAAARRLAEAGARLQVHDPRLEALPPELAGLGAEFFADPYHAARGATDLLLNSDLAAFAAPDFESLGELMPRGAVFDCLDRSDRRAARGAGLAHFAVGGPGWPPWLDPDFREFVARVRAETPEDARLLLWPVRPPVPSPRARWYLLLAHELAPRAVLLPEPELASGTAVQYRQWVERLGSDFAARQLDLPRLVTETRATHVVRFVPQADFRLADWGLEEVAR
jgi:hypothetical protein